MKASTFMFWFVVDVVTSTIYYAIVLGAAFGLGKAIHWAKDNGLNEQMALGAVGVEWVIYSCDTFVFLCWLLCFTYLSLRELWHALKIAHRSGGTGP
jgi:hypothetical protein